MASIIRVKRSTGTVAPPSLNYGELGLTVGVGTHGNNGGRLFAGDNSSNVQIIGGRYYADLLSIAPGLVAGQSNPTTPSNGFVAILDQNRKVDEWNVDNITIDGNTLSSTNTDGDINIDPNGSGEVSIPDDTYLSFGTSKDTKFRYDESTNDRFEVEGADWYYSSGVSITIDDTTASTSPSTGALVVTGGVGFGTDLNVGGSVDVDLDLNVDGGDITTNQSTFNLLDTNATTVNAFGAATSIDIGNTTGITTVHNNLDVDLDLNVDGGDITTNQTEFNLINTNAATVNAFGAATSIDIGNTTGITTVHNHLDIDLDLNVDGGDFTSNSKTFNILNSTVDTSNILGAGTTIIIGATTGVTTIRNAIVDLDGDLNVDGGDITTNQSTFNLLNTNATTVNAFGTATSIEIGSSSGTTNINNDLDVDGDVNIDGGDLTVSSSTFNIANNTATNINAFGAATDILIGATTGVTTIRNAIVDLDGNLNVDGGDITSNSLTFNFLNTNVTSANILGAGTTIVIGSTSGITTIQNEIVSFSNSSNSSYVSVAATTDATSTTTGALRVAGGAGIGGNLHIGGDLYVTGGSYIVGVTTFTNDVDITQDLTVDGNVTLGNGASDEILITGITTFTGDINQVGQFVNSGGLIIDNIGISSNVISTRSGGGDKLFIDPYPDGLSNEGIVIIKGDLQVDGTTTTVNSSTVTVNDPILVLGDVTSARTVMETVQVGVTTIRLDSVVGINTGDTVQGTTALGSGGIATVTSYDDSEKIITIDSNTTAGISTQTQLTITHAYNTNTDRGVSFDYNTSFGVSNNKTGFFGYDDSTGYWTFVPDATITNSVVSGIKGTLDIGALLLDFTTVGIHTRGSAYFDSNGKLISTNEPEVGYASTSNYILTTDASNTPVWTDTLDGGTF